jgi:hypothetical protein
MNHRTKIPASLRLRSALLAFFALLIVAAPAAARYAVFALGQDRVGSLARRKRQSDVRPLCDREVEVPAPDRYHRIAARPVGHGPAVCRASSERLLSDP